MEKINFQNIVHGQSIELSPEQKEKVLSCLSAQLWKYYNLEFDVERYECLEDNEVKLYGSTEFSANDTCIVKCKIFPCGTVEDLYLKTDSGFIEPTTTLQEQEER